MTRTAWERPWDRPGIHYTVGWEDVAVVRRAIPATRGDRLLAVAGAGALGLDLWADGGLDVTLVDVNPSQLGLAGLYHRLVVEDRRELAHTLSDGTPDGGATLAEDLADVAPVDVVRDVVARADATTGRLAAAGASEMRMVSLLQHLAAHRGEGPEGIAERLGAGINRARRSSTIRRSVGRSMTPVERGADITADVAGACFLDHLAEVVGAGDAADNPFLAVPLGLGPGIGGGCLPPLPDATPTGSGRFDLVAGDLLDDETFDGAFAVICLSNLPAFLDEVGWARLQARLAGLLDPNGVALYWDRAPLHRVAADGPLVRDDAMTAELRRHDRSWLNLGVEVVRRR